MTKTKIEKPTHYLICNKVFETLEEASTLAQEIIDKCNIFVEIRETKRKVTHIYELNK